MSTALVHTQEQQQTLEQQQRLTARQVAYMRMLEMPIETLRTRIEEELIDNPMLERDEEQDELPTGDEEQDEREAGDEERDMAAGDEERDMAAGDEQAEREELFDQDALDEMDYFESERGSTWQATEGDEDTHSVEDAEALNFRDTLLQQIPEYDLTEHQRTLIEYLIGSLDDDGLLKKHLYVIADELEIYNNVATNTDELAEVLAILQQFDPPGIGAQSLQETLTLQIDSRIRQKPESKLWPLLRRVVSERWSELSINRWDRIRSRLKINDGEVRALQRMLRTLTPSPGCAPSELQSSRRGENAIIADFIVEVSDEGNINIQLNEPDIPRLRVSNLRKIGSREAQQFVQSRVNRANSFIQNINSRRETLLRVMREVAMRQRDYLLTGDESRLHFLMMKDVAAATGTDLSIVSRVAGSKWVDTPYGMRRLRWFIRGTGGVKTDDGATLEQDHLKQAVADEIAHEDKQHPLNDEAITKRLVARGIPIARRTVAKYRESLGIPVARLRQKR